MEMIQVESSHIRAIGYDDAEAKLEIEFKDGVAYEYYGVPRHVYDELMSAASPGSYAHRNVYSNYQQQRIR